MVTLDELRATVFRMEQRLEALESPGIHALMRHYAELLPRFQQDLVDERDQLLYRGGALMLIQQVWEEGQ